jgi:hypothetical protein
MTVETKSDDIGDDIPRLTINKMVLINFKSYAGRVEIGPFHKVYIL